MPDCAFDERVDVCRHFLGEHSDDRIQVFDAVPDRSKKTGVRLLVSVDRRKSFDEIGYGDDSFLENDHQVALGVRAMHLLSLSVGGVPMNWEHSTSHNRTEDGRQSDYRHYFCAGAYGDEHVTAG